MKMPIALTLTDLTIVLVIEDMKAMVSIAQVNYILKGIHSDSNISISY